MSTRPPAMVARSIMSDSPRCPGCSRCRPRRSRPRRRAPRPRPRPRPADRDRHGRRLRVLADVDHRLLGHPVGGHPLAPGRSAPGSPSTCHCRRRVEDRGGGLLERRPEVTALRRRVQVEEQQPQPVGGAPHRPVELVEGVEDLAAGARQPSAQQAELDVDRGQRLHGVVVHVGRDPGTLGLLGLHQVVEQRLSLVRESLDLGLLLRRWEMSRCTVASSHGSPWSGAAPGSC